MSIPLVGAGPSAVSAGTRLLPENLLDVGGTIREDFEDKADWTALKGAVDDDTVNYYTGTQGIAVTKGVDAYASIEKEVSWDFSAADTLFRLYVRPEPISTASVNVSLYLAITDWSKYFGIDLELLVEADSTVARVRQFEKSDWTASGGMTWSDDIAKFRINVTPDITLDSFVFGGLDPVGAICLTFDDAFESQYDLVFSEFVSRNMVGTLYVNSNDLGGAGKFSGAEATEMFDAGWAVCNHSADHVHLDDEGDDGSAQLTEGKDDLTALDITTGDHVAYPYADFNDAVLGVMDTLSMKTGRTGFEVLDPLPPGDNYLLGGTPVEAADSLATVQGLVDDAKSKGLVYIFIFHDIVADSAAGSEWDLGDLQDLLDYIISEDIAHITIDELYRVQSSAIEVKEPGG